MLNFLRYLWHCIIWGSDQAARWEMMLNKLAELEKEERKCLYGIARTGKNKSKC